MTPLSKSLVRSLKSKAQLLQPVIHVGIAGITPALITATTNALQDHQLIKIKLSKHLPDKSSLAQSLASQTQSHLVTSIGHMIVLYKEKDPDGSKID